MGPQNTMAHTFADFVSKYTPARSYALGIGDAVADRTINRKLDPQTREELPALPYGVADNRPFVRETWEEVSFRVAEGNALLAPQHDAAFEFNRLNHHLRQASVLMSGRHLQHGDKNQLGKPGEIWTNCATSASTYIMFYLLLNGSGVGRSYDDVMMVVDYGQQPIVACTIDRSHADVQRGLIAAPTTAEIEEMYPTRKITTFHVPDSREGWAQALEQIEIMAFQKRRDEVLILDFSLVRPKNAPIRGMQNRPASGPEPLMSAINNIARLREAGMEPWRAAMHADHFVAECVLVGGARRAARMATKYWKDPDIFGFIEIKRGGVLWSSNNSVLVDAEFWKYVNSKEEDWAFHGPEVFEMYDKAKAVYDAITFSAYHDGTGEPGLINVDRLSWNPEGVQVYDDGSFINSRRLGPSDGAMALNQELVKSWKQAGYQVITNPCVTGDTLILTDRGNLPIQELVGEQVNVWNGSEWSSVTPFSTGFNSTVKIGFSNGAVLRCTPTHKFVLKDGSRVSAAELELGDALTDSLSTGGAEVYGPSVSSIELDQPCETFCVTEPKNSTVIFNGVLTGQCGEVVLSALGGYCTIADVVPYHATSDDDAEEAFRVATRALIRVNTMDFLYDKEVKRTNRIGVGMTGFHEWAWTRFGFGWKDLIDEQVSREFWLLVARFKRAVEDEAINYSKYLGVAVPATNTTFKPAGTTSALFGLCQGAHLPSMREYLRWVQFRNDDPLIAEYAAKGYPTRELKNYTGTTIVGFPTAPTICTLGMGDKLVTAPEASPEEQYQFIRLLEKYWLIGVEEDGVTPLTSRTDAQISYTLKYSPKTVSFEDFKRTFAAGQSTIKCCSVMPDADTSAYEYLPEDPISKHEFESIVAAILASQAADAAPVKEEVGFEHVDCASGACPVSWNENQ